jgi:predicted nucleotidyltransferase
LVFPLELVERGLGRRLRVLLAGGIHHVYNGVFRGARVFRDKAEADGFEALLAATKSKHWCPAPFRWIISILAADNGIMALMDTPGQNPDVERQIAARLDHADSKAVISAYLFGSRAEGRAHRESDIDIGVLMDREMLPTRKDRFEASLRLSARLGASLSTDQIDLVVLNDAPPLIGRRIVTGGRRIFCREPEVDHGFVRDVQLRAADILPFLDRMRKIKLEALAPR